MHHKTEAPSLLAALVSREEYTSLQRILSGRGWAMRFAPTFRDVGAALTSPIGVVVCAGRLGDGHCWKDVLSEVLRMQVPPQLIVADRLADESLWAEVLNFGCYDLVRTPFEKEEVLRVVPRAWDFWKRELQRTAARPKPPNPVEPRCLSTRNAVAAGAD